jgi:hypothetical protein
MNIARPTIRVVEHFDCVGMTVQRMFEEFPRRNSARPGSGWSLHGVIGTRSSCAIAHGAMIGPAGRTHRGASDERVLRPRRGNRFRDPHRGASLAREPPDLARHRLVAGARDREPQRRDGDLTAFYIPDGRLYVGGVGEEETGAEIVSTFSTHGSENRRLRGASRTDGERAIGSPC